VICDSRLDQIKSYIVNRNIIPSIANHSQRDIRISEMFDDIGIGLEPSSRAGEICERGYPSSQERCYLGFG